VPIIEEERKGSVPCRGKSTSRRREKAGMLYKGKGTGRKKAVEESRGSGNGMRGQATRSATRVGEELGSRIEEEDKEALWQGSARRSTPTRVRIDDRRNSGLVLNLQVQEKGVSCRRQPGARSSPFMEVEEVELVWM